MLPGNETKQEAADGGRYEGGGWREGWGRDGGGGEGMNMADDSDEEDEDNQPPGDDDDGGPDDGRDDDGGDDGDKMHEYGDDELPGMMKKMMLVGVNDGPDGGGDEDDYGTQSPDDEGKGIGNDEILGMMKRMWIPDEGPDDDEDEAEIGDEDEHGIPGPDGRMVNDEGGGEGNGAGDDEMLGMMKKMWIPDDGPDDGDDDEEEFANPGPGYIGGVVLKRPQDKEIDEEDDMVGYIGGRMTTLGDDDDEGKMKQEIETITSNLSSLLVIG